MHTYTDIMAAASPHAHPAAPAPDRRPEGRAGSRRIFPPQFKLQVLEAYRRDAQCRGNQRATARKFGIHRRQIQKWLQAEPALRAALLRRAPQPAPSPPPYAAGSPESARLPSSPPPTPVLSAVSLPTTVPMPTPLPQPVTAPPPHLAEPIDLSVRRASPPPALQSAPVPPLSAPSPPRKPFKLFRPYLLGEESEMRRPMPLVPVAVPAYLGLGAGCGLAACPAPRWPPTPAFPAPLR